MLEWRSGPYKKPRRAEPMSTAWQATDKRRLRGEKSKKAIIKAAIGAIAEQGLRGATLERVAHKAEVSRALVVFHFKSKTGMLTAVLNHVGNVYADGWDALLSTSGISTSDQLLRLLEYDVRFASERPDFLSVWHAFWGEAKGSSLYREVSYPRDERYESDLRKLLGDLAEEGGYENIDVSAVETGMFAMLFGLWRNSHLALDANDYDTGMQAIRVYLSKLFPRHY